MDCPFKNGGSGSATLVPRISNWDNFCILGPQVVLLPNRHAKGANQGD